MAIEFKDDIQVPDITINGNALGTNAFTSTTIPTNNNQLTNGAGYVTTSGNTTIGINQTNTLNTSTVFATLNFTNGVATSATTRTLTLGNLGFTGASNANYITNNNQLTNGSGYITSSSVGNATITLSAGTGLTGGGSFTANQSSNQTITFNASGGGSGTVSGTGTHRTLAMWASGGANIENAPFLCAGSTNTQLQLKDYTSTNTAANGAVNPSQNFQATGTGGDSVTDLCVTSTGVIVRGDQEATISFTAAQINAGFGGSGLTIISALEDKYVIPLDTTYLIQARNTFTPTGSVGFEIRQASPDNAFATVSVFTSTQFNNITSNSGSGIQSRDVPVVARGYKKSQPTKIHKIGSGSLPSSFTSLKVKIKYRVFDEGTF